MVLFWYIVVFLTFRSRLVQAAPLPSHCSTKTYAPCNNVEQSEGAYSEVSNKSVWPAVDAIGRVSSNNVECGAGIRCPCSILEKASPDLEDDTDDHTSDRKVACANVIPDSEDDEGNARYHCSCAPVLNSAECYKLAMPVLAMLALGLAVHSTLKSAQEHSKAKTNTNTGSNYAVFSVSGLEKSEKGMLVSSDAQDQDVESFDDSNFPMG